MRKLLKKNLLYIYGIASFAGFSHQVFNIVFPVYILDKGGSNALTGKMIIALTIATVIVRLVFSTLMDEWGRKRTLLLGSLLFMFNTFAYTIVDSFLGIFILRICNGISQGIFFPVPPTLVADNVEKDKLSDALGIFGIFAALPVAIAPTLGLVIYRKYGANILFFVSGFASFIAVLLSILVKDYYCPKENKVHLKERLNFNQILESSAFVPSIIYFFLYFGYSSILNYLTPYALLKGMDKIGYYFTVNTVLVVLTRLVVGRTTKKIEESSIIILSMGLSIGSIILVIIMQSLWMMMLSSILLAIGMTFVIQLTQTEALNRANSYRKGAANTTWMLFGDLGMGLGSVFLGYISTVFNYQYMYLIAAFIMVIGLIVGMSQRKKGEINL